MVTAPAFASVSKHDKKKITSVCIGAIRNYSLGEQAVPGPSVNRNTNLTHFKMFLWFSFKNLIYSQTIDKLLIRYFCL